MSEEAKAGNVVEALTRVMRDLPAIGKGERSEQGYSYRGIEQITKEAQPLLAKHGVLFCPEVVEWDEHQLTINNRPWSDQRLKVLYRVYGPGGIEDCITVGPICAIGRDNSDKGCNKAMSQAFKYALLQTLCIADAKDDGDAQTHEADAAEPAADKATREALKDTLGQLPDEHKAEMKDWFRSEKLPAVMRLTASQAEKVLARLDELKPIEDEGRPFTDEQPTLTEVPA